MLLFMNFGFPLTDGASINFSSREYSRLDNLAAFQKLSQATNQALGYAFIRYGKRLFL